MSKTANSWIISEVANGYIIAKGAGMGYASPPEDTFVFNSSDELADWIRRNLKQEEETHSEKA